MNPLGHREREGSERTGRPGLGEQPTTDDHARVDAGHWYVCAGCGEKVAHQSWQLDADISGPLVFSNPHGMVFELLLFLRVTGVVFSPYATREYTWFAGYAWRVAFCQGCDSHIGWLYESILSGQSTGRFAGVSRRAVKFVNGS